MQMIIYFLLYILSSILKMIIINSDFCKFFIILLSKIYLNFLKMRYLSFFSIIKKIFLKILKIYSQYFHIIIIFIILKKIFINNLKTLILLYYYEKLYIL